MFCRPAFITFSLLVLTFRFTKPRVLFAFAVIELMWSFQLRSLAILTPILLCLLPQVPINEGSTGCSMDVLTCNVEHLIFA